MIQCTTVIISSTEYHVQSLDIVTNQSTFIFPDTLSQNLSMLGRGFTKKILFARFGGHPTSTGLTNNSRWQTALNVAADAVAVKVRTIMLDGRTLLISPRWANAVLNWSPLKENQNYRKWPVFLWCCLTKISRSVPHLQQRQPASLCIQVPVTYSYILDCIQDSLG